jgi:multisubunit Na+/H+ antiporter MnhE subunit
MASVVSLLPGTLSAELSEDCMKVHVLDVNADALKELQSLEAKIGHLFGLEPLGRVISEE